MFGLEALVCGGMHQSVFDSRAPSVAVIAAMDQHVEWRDPSVTPKSAELLAHSRSGPTCAATSV